MILLPDDSSKSMVNPSKVNEMQIEEDENICYNEMSFFDVMTRRRRKTSLKSGENSELCLMSFQNLMEEWMCSNTIVKRNHRVNFEKNIQVTVDGIFNVVVANETIVFEQRLHYEDHTSVVGILPYFEKSVISS